MRCYCCDVILKTSEAVAQFKSGAYTEMCNKCIREADLQNQVVSKDVEEEVFDDNELDVEYDFEEDEE